MIRNGKPLFISFAVHSLLAAAAIVAFEAVTKEKPGEEAKMCISLAHYAEPVAKAPLPKPHPQTKHQAKPPEKRPEPPKKTEPPKPKVEETRIVEEAAPVVAQVKREQPKPEPKKPEPAEEPTEKAPEQAPEPEKNEPLEEVVSQEAAESEAPEAVAAKSAGEQYLQQHLAIISELLQKHLYYPRIARKRGITGEVVVAFELLSNGTAVHIDVQSGERTILNNAAVTTIERLSGRFPKPSEPITLHVPIRYELQ